MIATIIPSGKVCEMHKVLFFMIVIISLSIFTCERRSQAKDMNAVQASLPVLLDSLEVKAVTYWDDRLCIVRFVEKSYELEIYRKNTSNELMKIYSAKIFGIHHLDGTTSDDLLIVYGSSAVATEISLLRWDKENQRVVDFHDNRFDGDSRRQPEILTQPRGFQILTFGNINDTGFEPDESKWYANIYTFERGVLVFVKEKVPFSKRYCFAHGVGPNQVCE